VAIAASIPRTHQPARARPIVNWCNRTADRFAAFIARKPLLAVLTITLVHFAVALRWASSTPFNFDEVYTVSIASQPSLSAIWTTLATGIEQMPPFTHVAVHASQTVFGNGEVASRLPSLIGTWVMCVCLFFYISSLCTPIYGLLAAMSPLLMSVFDGAFRARAYGILVGATGLALLCWDLAASNRLRGISLFGLLSAMVIACSSHYYAPAVLAPIALGELVRTWRTRRFDLPVWLTMAAGMASLLAYLPLIRSAWGSVVALNWPISFFNVLVIYRTSIHPILLTTIGGLAVIAISRRMGLSLIGEPPARDVLSIPAHKITCLLGFAALPLILFLSAVCFTKVLHQSYATAMVIGFAGIFAVSVYYASDGKPLLPVALLLLVVGGLFSTAYKAANVASLRWDPRAALASPVFARETRIPVVVSDIGTFLEIWHYSSPPQSSRIYYLTDRESARKYIGTDTWENDVRRLQSVVHFNATDYREFTGKRFLLYERSGTEPIAWVRSKLMADGAHLELVGSTADASMYSVTWEQSYTVHAH